MLDGRLVGSPAVAAYDPLRLAIDVGDAPCDGPALAAALLRMADINLELVTERVLIAHVGIAEPVLEHGLRLVAALRHALGRFAAGDGGRAACPLGAPAFGEPVMAPRDAFFAGHEHVSLEDAAGRICADSIVVYPRGIANILPGERFTPQLSAYLAEMQARGGCLKGTWDASAGTVRVVDGDPGTQPRPVQPHRPQPPRENP